MKKQYNKVPKETFINTTEKVHVDITSSRYNTAIPGIFYGPWKKKRFPLKVNSHKKLSLQPTFIDMHIDEIKGKSCYMLFPENDVPKDIANSKSNEISTTENSLTNKRF